MITKIRHIKINLSAIHIAPKKHHAFPSSLQSTLQTNSIGVAELNKPHQFIIAKPISIQDVQMHKPKKTFIR
jgi:hypothetical protein